MVGARHFSLLAVETTDKSKRLSDKDDLSPEGAAECSPGREPRVHETPGLKTPKGRHKFRLRLDLCRSFGA